MNNVESIYNSILVSIGGYSLFFILVPIIIGTSKHIFLSKALKYILWLIFFDAIIGILLQVIIWISNEYQSLVLSIAQPFGIDSTNFVVILAYINHLIVLGLYFSEVLKNKKIGRIIFYLSWLLLLISSYDYFFITGYNNYSSFSQTLLAVYGFVMPSIHLWYIYQEDSKVALNKNPYFWISLGLLLPNIMTVWLELFGSRLYEEDFVLFCQVSIANSVFYCIGMLLIARGFYFARYVKYLPN